MTYVVMYNKKYFFEVVKMKKEQKDIKKGIVIFRASLDKVRQLDRLAKLIGANRSEALRRLIPDLTTKKDLTKCVK